MGGLAQYPQIKILSVWERGLWAEVEFMSAVTGFCPTGLKRFPK